MRRLLKAQQQQHQQILERLDRAREECSEAISAATEFMLEIHDQQDGYFSARSEQWQESERGGTYEEWMDLWGEGLDPENIDDAHNHFEAIPLTIDG